MNWTLLLMVLASLALLYFLWQEVRNNPQAFSKDNLGKSLTTVGLLALLIIGVVTVCVWFLRHSGGGA